MASNFPEIFQIQNIWRKVAQDKNFEKNWNEKFPGEKIAGQNLVKKFAESLGPQGLNHFKS